MKFTELTSAQQFELIKVASVTGIALGIIALIAFIILNNDGEIGNSLNPFKKAFDVDFDDLVKKVNEVVDNGKGYSLVDSTKYGDYTFENGVLKSSVSVDYVETTGTGG